MKYLLELGLWGFLGWVVGQVIAIAIACYTIYSLALLL